MRPSLIPRPKIAVLTVSIAAFLTSLAPAATVTWDANAATAPNPDGGTGIWDVNTSLNWWDSANNVVWPVPGGFNDDAIFANNAGTVSIAVGGVTANDLTFSTTGYIVQSNTLTLDGTTPTITTDTGVSTTISSVIAGSSGLVKAGNGTLTLSGINTYSGGTTVAAGTLKLDLTSRTVGNINVGSIAIASTATLELFNTNAAVDNPSGLFNGPSAFTGNGIINKTGAGYVGFWNSGASPTSIKDFTGTINVQGGTLGSNGGDWNNPACSMILNLSPGTTFDVRTGAVYVDQLNGSGTVTSTFNSGNALFVGTAGGSSTFSGIMQNGSATRPLTKLGTGTFTLTGANTYTGTTTISGGMLQIGNGGTTGTLGTGAVTVNSPGNLTLNRSNALTVANAISGSGTLTQAGTGTTTLTGASTYTGATTISSGGLLLNGGTLSASSPVSVAAGATFGGRGSAGAVTTNGGNIQGGVANAGSLSLTALTFNGSSTLNLMPVTGTTASVAVSGAVTTSGTQTLNIVNSTLLPNGTYRLVSYSSLAGDGLGAFVLGTTPFQPPTFRARTYTLDTTTSPASYVGLTVFADAPVWTGGTDANWDTTTNGNWNLVSDNTTPTTFFPGDMVQFNDTTGPRDVVIPAAVSPTSVAFNNSTGNDYTLTGASGIAGTASLTKAGNGTLTITNTNTYTGGTTISGGTLEIGNGTTNGVLAGAITNTATLSFRNATAQTHSGLISGAGTVSKTGAAPLTLSGANNYTGPTSISGGGILIAPTLAPNGTNSAIGTGSAGNNILIDDGTFRYSGPSLGGNAITTQFNRAVTVGIGGATLDNRGSGFLFYNGTITGSGNLSFIDSSGDTNNQQWLLTSNNPGFFGNITIGTGAPNSGWVQYRSNAAAPLGSGTVTVNGGGIYSTDGGATTPLATISNSFILNGGTLRSQNAAAGFLGTVTVNAGTSFFQADNTSNLVFHNSLIGSGTITETTAVGTASVELRGNNSSFTGTYNHTGAGATIFFTAASSNAAATWNIPSGANVNARFAAGGTNATYQLGALSGITGRVENFSAAAGNSTFEVGALNTNTSFVGTIVNGAGGTVGLTKVGTGTLTLGGNNTYTGLTIVTDGSLLLNAGALSTSSAVSVAPATTFGGRGSAGFVSLSEGTTLQGGFANAGSLALTSLVFGGSSTVNLMPVLGSPTVAVSGSVTTSGTQTLNITSSFPLPGGSYQLISYTSINGAGIGAFELGSLPASVPGARPRIYNLDTTTAPGSYVGLNVISDSPIWTGSNNGNWDTTTPNNWALASNPAIPTTYFTADFAPFNDTAGNRNLLINGTDVAPSGVAFNNSIGNDYTIAGANGIAGPTALQKTGTGRLTIANTNTYTGDTTVSGGVLQIGNSTTNGAIAGNIINTSSVVFHSVTNQTHAGNITGALGSLTKVGPGTLTLTGVNTYSGGTTITGGTLQIGNGTVNGSIGIGAYSVAAGATLYLNYATAVAATWANITGAGKLELNSAQPINGSANWNPVAMSLPAAFTGTLHVERGRVHGTPVSFGGTTNIVLANGSQFLAFDGSTAGNPYTFPQSFSLAGVGWGESGFELGALRNSGMNATFSGNITLAGNSGILTQVSSNGTSTITGPITDGGAGFSLAINAGSNFIRFNNPGNSYGGDTNVLIGTFRVGASEVIPDGPGKGNVAVTSTFDLNTFNETINGLSGAGFVDNLAAGNPTLTVGNNNATSSFTGIIRNTVGTLGLTKIGSGTLTLAGVNTYIGATTISAGTLLVNGSISGSTVAVDGGTLGGTAGNLGATTVAIGGTLAPGATGTSIATLNFLSLGLGGTSAFEINKTGVALTSDLANVTSTLTLGGILNVTASGDTLFPGDTFNLFDAGTFSGSFTTVNTPPLSDISYSWDTSNLSTNGTLTVVPEPTTVFSLLGGLSMLLGLRRRRHA